MRRFTVSLPDDLYAALRRRGDEATPPASLQQMVRYAVDSLVHGEPVQSETAATALVPDASPGAKTSRPTDLLVFTVGEVNYGIPIELVETVAAGLAIHQIPTVSGSLLGVARFREGLTEVHDGGTVLQNRPLHSDETPSLLAIPGTRERVLMSVTAVTGLTPATEIRWSDPPESAPDWVMALAWNDDEVIAVVDPSGFNL